MIAIDPEIAEIFNAEANERLDRIVETLLAIEAGEGDAPAGAIDTMFRDAHSIKGSAAMVGCDQTRGIAHSMEDVLGTAREAGALAAGLVETLLSAADALRHAVTSETALEGDPPAPELAAVAAEPQAAPQRQDERRSIRMPTAKVDRLLEAVGENVVQTRRLEHVLRTSLGANGDERTSWELGRGKFLLDELQRAAIDMRTLPLGSITAAYPRAVRDLALASGKEILLEISGTETQLDRVILDGISDAISHLLRNCVAHGIESPAERERAGKPREGRIALRAEQRGSFVAIEVSDDGGGVDPSVLERGTDGGSLAEVLSKPGFSTASEVTDVAGRGVGLDAVKQHVESFGGTLVVDSEPGAGMVVTLLLPYSVALMRVLLIERGEQVFGVPLASVEEVTVVGSLLTLVGSESLEVHGEAVPLRDLATLVGAQATELGPQPRAVIVMSSRRRQAVACDRVVGEREVMLKSLGKLLSGVPGYLGAAIIDDGGIAPILDPAFLARQIAGTALPAVQEGSEEPSAPKVLVVDDQFTVRELQRSILEAAGYRVVTARDGREAWSQLADDAEVQLVVTDVQMPEMDGIELLQKIRADPRRSAIPVVVLTSLAADGEKQRGADAGADAYIVKDEFDQRALLDTVERLLVLR